MADVWPELYRLWRALENASELWICPPAFEIGRRFDYRDMSFTAFTQGASIDQGGVFNQGVATADDGEEDFEIGATAKRAPVAVLL